MTLDQMIIRASETAESIFSRDGGIDPIWIGQTAQGEIIPVIGHAPDGPEDMAGMLEQTRAAFAHLGVVRYVSIIEGYSLSGEPAREFNGKGDLSDNPDARHCVHMLAVDIEGKSRAAVRYILKPDKPDARPTLAALKDLNLRPAGLLAELLQPANAGDATRH